MGFDFHVKYKAGRLNQRADTSHREEEVGTFLAISQPHSLLLKDIKAKLQSSSTLQDLKHWIKQEGYGTEVGY